MRKMLPYNFDNGLTMECGNFYRMAVIGAYGDTYLPWTIERFLRIQMYEDYVIFYYYLHGMELQTYYDEVLEQREIHEKVDIISTIINEIDKGGYVQIRCNRYYVPGGAEYQSINRTHPMLILGYDDGLEELYVTDVHLNKVIWGLHTYKFSVIEKAYYEGLKMMRDNFATAFGPIEYTQGCIFNLKPFTRELRLKYIYDCICWLLKGGEIIDRSKRLSDDRTSIRRLGISIYNFYIEDLYDVLAMDVNQEILKKGFGIHHCLGIFYQHKQCLLYRLKYLMENNYINKDETVLDNAKQVCSVIEECRNIIAKFHHTHDLNSIKRASEKFKKAEILERTVLEGAKELLEEALRKRFEETVAFL